MDPIFRPAVDLGPFIGVLLVGSFVSMALWGVACMQTFQFFRSNHAGDTWRLKTLVIWSLTCDTVEKCLLIAGSYKAVVSGEAMTPGPPGTEYTLSIMTTALVAVPIQLYFTWRIWRFPNAIRWVLVAFLVPAILYHLVTNIYLTIEFLKPSRSIAEQDLHIKLLSSSLSIEGLVNVILSIGLCALIWRLYPRTDEAAKSRSTISMVRRLMFISILTGIWTAAFGVLCMAMVLKYPTNSVHVAFCFIISPVYCVMLLANLNARAYIREGVSVVNFDSSRVSGLSLKDISYRSRRSMATTTNHTERTGTTMAEGSIRDSKMVHVTIETSTHPDYDDRDIKDKDDLIQSPV